MPSDRPGPRGARLTVPLAALRPNPWNPNRQSEATAHKLGRSLGRFGVVTEILVREAAGGALEIVDGEHRWRQLQAAGAPTVEVRNLGPIPDAEAKKLTVIMNELSGTPAPARLAALLRDLEAAGALPAAAEVLPYSDTEIATLLALLEPTLSADALAADLECHLAANTPRIPERAPRGERFVLANYCGWVPPPVAAAFDVAWDAIGRRTGSPDPAPRARALARVLAAARKEPQ
jgi:ParB family chromosome partitioning protein